MTRGILQKCGARKILGGKTWSESSYRLSSKKTDFWYPISKIKSTFGITAQGEKIQPFGEKELNKKTTGEYVGTLATVPPQL